MLKSPGLERAGLQSRHKQTRINPALSAEGMLKVSVRLLLQPRPRPHRRTNLKGFSRHRNASPPDRRSRQHDGAPPQTHVRRRHPGCRRSLRPALCHDPLRAQCLATSPACVVAARRHQGQRAVPHIQNLQSLQGRWPTHPLPQLRAPFIAPLSHAMSGTQSRKSRFYPAG